MILLKQNTTNQVTVTLSEKKKSLTDTYLFEVINRTSQETTYAILEDSSQRKERYNKFSIGLSADNPSNGEMSLPLNGFYIYNIYENPFGVGSPSNLNLVESGKLLVIGDINEFPAYVNESADFIIYNPTSEQVQLLIDANGDFVVDADNSKIPIQ